MTSKQIEALLDLAETFSFTKTSRNLFIAQPTLTYQINSLEAELGFKLFDRSQNGVSLTPAGKSFVKNVRRLRGEYKRALEEAQNYSENYTDDIVISLPYRSAISLLPQAIIKMSEQSPSTLITPRFGWRNRLNDFLSGQIDILFEDYEEVKNLKDVEIIPFYESKIYLICNKEDVLSAKSLIEPSDLIDRKLMVGGGSQLNLKKVQNMMINQYHVAHFNSDDHDTTLTNIEAYKGVVLAPGFLHDRNDVFCWIPFNCKEKIQCCLAVKKTNNRANIKLFIDILLNLYKEANIEDL